MSKKRERAELKADIDRFHTECLNNAYCANLKAKSNYYLNHLSSLVIILSGAVIGILSLYKGCDTYIVASIGFAITALKTVLSVYSPERRTVQLKTIAQNLSRLARDIKRLGSLSISLDQLQTRLEQYHEEYDNLDLAMYDLGNVNRLTQILGKGLPNETDLPGV